MGKYLFLFVTCMTLAQNAWSDDLPKIDPKSIQSPVTKPADIQPSMTITHLSSDQGASAAGTPVGDPRADENCQSTFKQAAVICVANLNPSVQSAVSTISKMVAAGGAALSMADACNKFNDALKVANEAITAYNSACAAVQYRCKFSCSHAATRSHELAQKEMNNTATYAQGQLHESIAQADDHNAEICATTFHKNMVDAGIGLAGIVTSSAMASSCQDKTTDKTAAACDSANPLCVKGVDCSLSSNASNPTCICNASPNAPGCPGSTSYGSAYGGSPNYGTGGDTATQTSFPASSGAGAADLSGTTRGGTAPTAAADGASTSAGGGGAIGGGGMSATGAAQNAATADKAKSLNPNILSGYDEGGGGGARGGGGLSAGGYGMGSRYGAYMPGAAKDPSRSLASQALSNQVTSAGAKSNWEKINERYLENKSTLMGE